MCMCVYTYIYIYICTLYQHIYIYIYLSLSLSLPMLKYIPLRGALAAALVARGVEVGAPAARLHGPWLLV